MQVKMKIVCFFLIMFTLFSTATIANSIEVSNGYYIVKQGDTISSIASHFGVSAQDITDWNHLPTPTVIFPGKLLKIGTSLIPVKPSYPTLNGAVSINFVDTDIRDVLSSVAIELKKNILYVGVPMRFTIRASKVDRASLIDVVVDTAGGMSWVESGDLIIIGPKEKISADFVNNLMFTGISLRYITAPEIESQALKLNIDVKTVTIKEALNKIWVSGTPTEIARFYQLVNSLDRKENFPDIGSSVGRSTFYKQYNFNYVTAEVFREALSQFDIPVIFSISSSNPMIAFVSGPATSKVEFEALLAKIDIKENTGNPNSGDLVGLTKYVLKYIAYSDAENLLTNAKLDISVMDLKSYPKTVFFFGPRSYRDEALRLLKSVDIRGDIIKEIIDFAPSTAKLGARRDLICSLTGYDASNFVISPDIERDALIEKYILYYTGTEAEIARIRKVVSLIDAPLGGT